MKNNSTFSILVLFVSLILAADKSSQAQWFPQPSHLTGNNYPAFIDAVDTNIVWAVTQYQQFTKTINGGFSWEPGTINNATGFGGSSVCALNADTVWVAMYKISGAGGRILKTTDGGANWVYQSTAHFTGAGAFADFVFFWDRDHGICVGDPTTGYFEIYTTTDGGDNWIRTPSSDIPLPLTGEYGIQDDYATYGDSTIWFGTDSGRVYKSIDRGFHWSVANTPYYQPPYSFSVGSIAFKDSLHGLAGAGLTMAGNDVISTSDGGATWTIFNGVTDSLYYKLSMAYMPGSSGTYFLSSTTYVGLRGTAISTDDGHSWTTIDTLSHSDLDFVNSTLGWSGSAVLDSSTNSYLIYRWGSPALISGINTVKSSQNSLSVFPNPFSESFELKNSSPEKSTLKVFDLQGNLLITEEINPFEKISLGKDFPDGVYLVEIITTEKISSVKVVKMK